MNKIMLKLVVRLQTLTVREDAQDLVEYALVAALVAFGATASLHKLGGGVNTAFTNVSSVLSSSLS
jgi:Flp pilus assembly pilin Flp